MSRGVVPRIARAAVGALLIAVFSVGSVHAAPTTRAEPTAAGLWEQVDDDGSVGAWFHIFERNGVYLGMIVRAFSKPGERVHTTCEKCPGEQKNAPMIGLTIIKGMQRKGRAYENGSILDPRDGSVYKAVMEVSPDGQKLTVRGYLGIELFGKSQVWRRLPDSAMPQTRAPAAPGAAAPGPQEGRASPPAAGNPPAPATPAPAPAPAPASRP
jgi:uncharacterized protein (DUF2147 family)